MQEENSKTMVSKKLIELPREKKVVETKMYKNKFNENDNKIILLIKTYLEQKGLNYIEFYVHVVPLETIKILLSFSYI